VAEKKKEAYEDEVERLYSLGIFEPVAGHTNWIKSIVPVAKPDGSIRVSRGTSTTPRRLTKFSSELHG